MREIWKVVPRVPHGQLEGALNRLEQEGWSPMEFLHAGQDETESFVT